MLPTVIIYTRIIALTVVVRLRQTGITAANERVQRWYFGGRGEGEKKLSESAGDLKR